MRKLGRDLDFTLEALFIQICSGDIYCKDLKEYLDLVSNYNDHIYGALVRALLHKPALIDEEGENVGNFVPIEETDFIDFQSLFDLHDWIKAMNHIVDEYRKRNELIRIDERKAALGDFIAYVKSDEFRYKCRHPHKVYYGDPFSTAFYFEELPLPEGFKDRYCEELPLPEGFKDGYCRPIAVIVNLEPDKTKSNKIWLIALFIITGAIALSYCLFFRGSRMGNVIGSDNAFGRIPISR